MQSPPDALRAFQAALREHRKAAGLSHRLLGLALGMTRQNVAELETSGRDPTLSTAERVAAAFGCDLATFLTAGKETLAQSSKVD